MRNGSRIIVPLRDGVGVVDGLAQTTAYTTMRVNAIRTVAEAAKTEWF